MGGAQAGEVASRIAAGAFEHGGRLSERGAARASSSGSPRTPTARSTSSPSADSSRAGHGHHADRGDGPRRRGRRFGHVGDSRAYVLREGELKRLTKDHSLVEELRRQGRLTDEQAEEHPQRSIITRALGPEPSVNVDTMTFPAKNGDVFLLCSDGLTTMVSRRRDPRRSSAEARTLRSAVNKLVDAANRGGGRDNITAVAFRLADAGEEVEEGATLISRTAEQAGLTGERMRAAGDRLRGRGPMPLPHRRRRGLRIAAVVALIAAVVVGGGLPGRARSTSSAPTSDGRVALYRGLPYDLPLGISLYSKQYSIRVQEGTALGRAPAVSSPSTRCAPRATPPTSLDDIEQRRRSGCRRRPHRQPARRRQQQRASSNGQQAEEELSARNRELFALIPVALLVTAGFTAVLIVNSDQLGNLSVVYGAYFLGRLRRHPLRHPHPAARRRSLPLPAGGAARRLRRGDALPARRGAGA